MHDDNGHRGREGIYRRVVDWYWWESLYEDSAAYVRTCDSCQRRSTRREKEALVPTWQKVAVDVVHMPLRENKNYLVVAHDDFSGWPEARASSAATSMAVARFLYEDVICRHGCFQRLILDGGPENKDVVDDLAQRYRIWRIVTSAYHPQANGMVERGHQPIVDGLAKMTDGGRYNWVRNLHAILWADRTTVKRTTGMSPYRINYGNDGVLPIELANPTWQIVDVERAQSTAELLALRARQLQRRDEDLEETALFLRRMRESHKELFDDGHRIRLAPFAVDDLVSLYDTKLEKSYSYKLTFRWLGPFCIAEVNADKGTYVLKELDDSIMKGTVNGSRLKRFYSQAELDADNNEFAADAGSEDMDEVESVDGRMEQRLRPRRQSDKLAAEEVVLPSPDRGFSIVVPPLQLDQPLDFIHTS